MQNKLNPSDSPASDVEQRPAPPEAVNETRQSINDNEAYTERQNVGSVDPVGNSVVNQTEVYEDENLRRASLRYWLTALISFLFGVLEVILGLRFVFRLLGANEGSDFVSSLYNFSHVFVAPFNGIFNDQTIGNRSVLELSTLVAILIYALVGWGLISLVRVMLAPDYSGRSEVNTVRKLHE